MHPNCKPSIFNMRTGRFSLVSKMIHTFFQPSDKNGSQEQEVRSDTYCAICCYCYSNIKGTFCDPNVTERAL